LIEGSSVTQEAVAGARQYLSSGTSAPRELFPGHPTIRVNPYPRTNPRAGEITQLAIIRNTFLEFMTRILLANPEPIIPEETVSVVDNGTPNWFANSTVPAPNSWE